MGCKYIDNEYIHVDDSMKYPIIDTLWIPQDNSMSLYDTILRLLQTVHSHWVTLHRTMHTICHLISLEWFIIFISLYECSKYYGMPREGRFKNTDVFCSQHTGKIDDIIFFSSPPHCFPERTRGWCISRQRIAVFI